MRIDRNTGVLFRGAIRATMARYLAVALPPLLGRYRRFVNPCAGTFAISRAAVGAGFEAENVVLGDIGLMSAVLGCAVQRRPVSAIGVRIVCPRLQPLAEMLEGESGHGAVLAAIKACQYREDKPYERPLLRELERDWAAAAAALQSQVDALTARLAGASFELADMWAQIATYRDDPEAVIMIGTPAYQGGYGRMFDVTGRVEWDVPTIEEFNPKGGQDRLAAEMADAKALCLWADYRGVIGQGTEMVFFEAGRSATSAHWWLTNRPAEWPKRAATPPLTAVRPSKYPLWPADRPVTADTKVAFVKTTKEVALYYRDLLAHKLGVTASEQYYLCLFDGHVMSVFGIHWASVNLGETTLLSETFGFSVRSRLYARMGRLFMSLLVCGAAGAFFRAQAQPLRKIEGIKTTCITTHPEHKTARRIFKMTKRERRKDGRYHLCYEAEFNQKSFADVVAEWLVRDAGFAPKSVAGGEPVHAHG